MTKSLYLLRHAQALEKQQGQTDKERYLTSIGLQNASKMGINLSKKDLQFDIFISSPAERALATAGRIAEQVKYDPHKIHVNNEVYEASVRTLLQVINQLKNDWDSVLIVGHNPSISYLSEYITDQEVGNVHTCGAVHIQFDLENWAEVSKGNGNLVAYEYPTLLNF